MSSAISKATTVQLDVGGTPYKVSLSLIENFPDSMLASIVSNKWKESEEQIFIERNGHLFRYVLDYMRDGKVILPKGECVEVESIYEELAYFGIEYNVTHILSKDRLKPLEKTDFYKFYLESFETSKQTFGKDYVETLITIVQFDVGGTAYKVSLSLIESFPDSMLSSIVSNKWKENSEEEIFIERNGHRFQYVLDYMRDGEVTLPKGECVESLTKELDYFGIEYESTKISSNDSLNIPDSIEKYRAYLENFQTMKHYQARSHVVTLITIDIINKALDQFPGAKYSEFEVKYSRDI